MIVVECSAAVEMARSTPQGHAFRSLMLKGEPTTSTALFQVEVRDAFREYVRQGSLSEREAQAYIDAALGLVDRFVPIEANASEAFHESVRQGCPVRDLLYVTVARREAATLLTADERLVVLCDGMGVDCVHEARLSVEDIRSAVVPLAKAYGAKRVSLFGSYARGEETDQSDVDILLEKGAIKGAQVLDFEEDLSRALGKKADVVTTQGLGERFAARIAQDEVVLYAS